MITDLGERAGLVAAGIFAAHVLDLPFNIRGREIRVPPSVAETLRPGNDEPATDAKTLDSQAMAELARRLAFAMRVAQHELDSTGVAMGFVQPETSASARSPVASQPESSAPATSQPPEPELLPMPEVLRRADDQWIIGNVLEVRRSTASSWYVAHMKTNQLLGWHPNDRAAIGWAIGQITSGEIYAAPGARFEQSRTWPLQPKVAAPPTILPPMVPTPQIVRTPPSPPAPPPAPPRKTTPTKIEVDNTKAPLPEPQPVLNDHFVENVGCYQIRCQRDPQRQIEHDFRIVHVAGARVETMSNHGSLEVARAAANVLIAKGVRS